MTTSIGLVPAIQDLQQKVVQAAAQVAKTADLAKSVTSPNGMKVPSATSLKKLLGALPTGIATIGSIAQTFENVQNINLSQLNGIGNFLNSAVGTAQNVAGAIQSITGAASSLGINIEALGGLSEALTGISTSARQGATNKFSLTPRFQWEIETESEGVIFPPDLGDYPKLQISISEYEKGQVTQKAKYIQERSVFLPMPLNLSENYGISWSAYSPGPKRALLDTILTNLQDYAKADNPLVALGSSLLEGGEQALNNAMKSYKNSDADEKNANLAGLGVFGLYYLGQTESDEYKILSNFAGKTVNPYTTVAFNGPMLRSHNFTWFFAPKSKEESQLVLKILNIFRKAALPRKLQGAFLEYPRVLDLRFVPQDKDIYNFKKCVITNLNINHAASGQVSFFNDTNLPTVYAMTLSLQEIELYTHEDVGVSSQEMEKRAQVGVTDMTLQNITNFKPDDENLFGFD